jgi:hypothetical protein
VAPHNPINEPWPLLEDSQQISFYRVRVSALHTTPNLEDLAFIFIPPQHRQGRPAIPPDTGQLGYFRIAISHNHLRQPLRGMSYIIKYLNPKILNIQQKFPFQDYVINY